MPIVLASMLVGLLFTSAGCDMSDKKDDKKGDNGKVESVDTTAAAIEESKTKPVAIGNAAKVGNWDVTVNSVDLDATERIVKFDEYNTPPSEEGSIYVMANVTAKYNGDKDTLIWGDLAYYFQTADGTVIDPLSLLIPEDLMTDKTFKKGTEITGNIGFEVPADAVDGGLVSFESFAKGPLGTVFYRIK